MGKLAFVSQIYELSQLVNRADIHLCSAKLVAFFVLDAVSVIDSNTMDKWPALHRALNIAGICFSTLLALAVAIAYLQPSVVVQRLTLRIASALIFVADYLVLPFKTLLLLPMIRTSGYMTILVAADWIFTAVTVQLIITFLRDFKPSANRFFSVLASPCENMLSLFMPARSLLYAFMNTRTRGMVSLVVRAIVVFLAGGFVLFFMLWRRPFFNKWTEMLFCGGVLINTLLLESYTILGNISSALKFIITSGPLLLAALLAYLSVPLLPKFYPTKKGQFWEIKSILLGVSPDLSSVGSRGQMRAHLLTHKKFSLVFAPQAKTSLKLTTTMGSFNALKTFTQNRLPEFKDDIKSRSNPSLAPPYQSVNLPSPSLFSKKGEEEQSRREYSVASPTVLSPTVLSPTMTLQPISDQSRKPPQSTKTTNTILNEMIIDNYLGDDQKGYPAFLYLMWTIEHKITLGALLSLLANLRDTQRLFIGDFYYLTAKKEIEKKLTEIVTNNREAFKSISRSANLNKTSQKNNKEKDGGKNSGHNGHQIQRDIVEQVDISEAFFLKSQLTTLSEHIKSYSRLNIEYVDSLTLTTQDLYRRSKLVQQMYMLDCQVIGIYKSIDLISTEQNFQHLVLYFYHAHINSNKHRISAKVKSDINKRFKSMRSVYLRYLKKVSNLNYLNECVLLMVESQRNKFGTILDIYGKTEMFLEDPFELIGASYTLFMNNSLKDFHDQLEAAIFDDNMNTHDSFNFVLSRPGFIKVPFRSIILPSMVMVRICPLQQAGFKFIVAIKPDFSDDKLYIALTSELNLDGYSSSFLNIISEEYLKNDIGLQTMSVHVQNRISNYHQLDADQNKSKIDKSKMSKKKVSSRNPIRQHLETRTANFFIEDARSARSVLNSAQDSGGRSDNPTNSDMTRDIVLDERLHFLHTENEDMDPEVRSFKILLKYHNYPSKIIGSQQMKGYWYLCLTLTGEVGLFVDLPMATPTDQIDNDHSLTPSMRVRDNKVNNASEGRLM